MFRISHKLLFKYILQYDHFSINKRSLSSNCNRKYKVKEIETNSVSKDYTLFYNYRVCVSVCTHVCTHTCTYTLLCNQCVCLPKMDTLKPNLQCAGVGVGLWEVI